MMDQAFPGAQRFCTILSINSIKTCLDAEVEGTYSTVCSRAEDKGFWLDMNTVGVACFAIH